MSEHAEHTRYLGVLGLLGECSAYVPDDLREMIEVSFDDACAADSHLRWRRILDRLEILSAACPSPAPATAGEKQDPGEGLTKNGSEAK